MAYFIDQVNGSDANNGNTWATAFRSLDRLAGMSITDAIFLSPGIHLLRVADKADLRTLYGVAQLVGVGGVIIRSDGASCGLVVGIDTSLIFHNIVLTPHTIRVESPGTWGPSLAFVNCDIHNEAIDCPYTSLSSARSIVFRRCNLQPALPAGGTGASAVTFTPATPGPFAFTAPEHGLHFQNYRASEHGPNNTGCAVGALDFLIPNDPLRGATPVMPFAVQYMSLGPSFKGLHEVSYNSNNHELSGLITRYDLTGDLFPDPPPATGRERMKHTAWLPTPDPDVSFKLVDDEAITMTAGDGGTVASPVFYYPTGVILSGVLVNAVEFTAPDNTAQVIDSTPLTVERTLEYRYADTPFLQDDAVLPWLTAPRGPDGISPAVVAKYIQYRLTFQLNAVSA